MHRILLVAMMMIVMALGGCSPGIDVDNGNDKGEETAPDPQEPEPGDEVAPVEFAIIDRGQAGDTEIPRPAADDMVRQFAAAVNDGAAALLLDIMTHDDDQYYTAEWAQAALTNYHLYFQGQKLAGAVFHGTAPDTDALHYSVHSVDYEWDVYVAARYVDGSLDTGDLRVYDTIFLYSLPAERYLEQFTIAISERDAERVAGLLTYDDYADPYPVDKAREIIGTFEQHFELDTLAVSFAGRAGQGTLVYSLTGKKDGADMSRDITIVCGDGLVGIKDEWIPPKR